MKTYPINILLKNKLVVLVGGNHEIARKMRQLLEAEAKIRIIAPSAHPRIQEYAAQGKVEYLARNYQTGDLNGAALVIACAEDQDIHDAVWAEGEANGQLVSVLDVLHQCNFYNSSIVRQGLLTISIGTGGAAPALSATLRKRFEKGFGQEYADFLDYAMELRPIVAERVAPERRRDFWYELVESDAIRVLRKGHHALFQANVELLLNKYSRPAQDEKDQIEAVLEGVVEQVTA